MSSIDWMVLCITLAGIVLYGMWKSRNTRNINTYLRADRQLPWYHVGLSVMATQASAITFLAGPGMGFTDGLRFVQFYFGLPLAMIVLCVTFIPIFHKLNVYTAYEFLEKRFDTKTRSLTAFLFLLQRGLSTGITIYAPAIVLSVILQIDIFYTTFIMGGLVIVYTVYGGTKAVSYTQLLQMIIIFSGLIVAAVVVVRMLPGNIGFTDALHIAGKMDRMKAIDTQFAWDNQYNIWSGIIGGFFLQLSYFGTDQSQVGRYLTGKSVAQSRLGLIMNGLIKIPMQFFILLIGVLVFSFYQFVQPPVFFNPVEVEQLENSQYRNELHALQQEQTILFNEKKKEIEKMALQIQHRHSGAKTADGEKLKRINQQELLIKTKVIDLMEKNNHGIRPNDNNYIFLNFVTTYLPVGLVGLLIAIIFLAAMGSTASGLNSLASTTMVDFHKRFSKKQRTEQQEVTVSRWYTLGWGVFCMCVAFFASQLGNLIEVVNILGSLFYGTILGIFLVAFYMKKVSGTAVFYAALLAEVFVVLSWWFNLTAFLWLNVIGCLLVMGLAFAMHTFTNKKAPLQ